MGSLRPFSFLGFVSYATVDWGHFQSDFWKIPQTKDDCKEDCGGFLLSFYRITFEIRDLPSSA